VVGLDQVVDRIGQLAAAPVLEAVDLALAALDQRLVALDHGGHLLALVRMDQEHDFIVTHECFPCGYSAATRKAVARIAPRRSWPDAVGQGLPARGSRALSQSGDRGATAGPGYGPTESEAGRGYAPDDFTGGPFTAATR